MVIIKNKYFFKKQPKEKTHKMKKILLIALVLVSSWNTNFASDTDSTCTKNCNEVTFNTLIGEWAYTNFSYNIVDRIHECEDLIIADDAFLKFDFDANGIYTKTYGSGNNETTEVGNWEITADGESLVLFPMDGAAAQYIKIGKMEDEKIELELNIEAVGLSDLFCTQLNVLNFSKNILPLNNSVIK